MENKEGDQSKMLETVLTISSFEQSFKDLYKVRIEKETMDVIFDSPQYISIPLKSIRDIEDNGVTVSIYTDAFGVTLWKNSVIVHVVGWRK